MILVLMSLFLSLIVYSQDTSKLNLREITRYLAEGVECKEILSVRNQQIRNRDSIISNYKSISILNKNKDSIYSILIKELKTDNITCTTEYNKLNTKYTMKKRTNTILTISQTISIAIIVLILL